MKRPIEEKFTALLVGLSLEELERFFCFTAFYVWKKRKKKIDATYLQLVRGAWFYYQFAAMKALRLA